MNLDIRKVPLEQVNPAPYNPRKELQPGEPEYEKLKRSLEAFGCVEPLVWNQRTGNLVGGHQRFNVLRNEGWITDGLVAVSVVDLNPDQEKALNVALNKITGVWDDEKLAVLLQELRNDEFDLDLTGFDSDEIESIIEDFLPDSLDLDDEVQEDNFDVQGVLDQIDQPETMYGDVWQLGRHLLVCGDATKIEDVERLMQGKRADLVVTDPPYNVDVESDSSELAEAGRSKIMNDDMPEEEFEQFIFRVFENYLVSMNEKAAIYIFHPYSYQRLFENAMNAAGIVLRTQCIWVKNQSSFGWAQYGYQHEPIFYAHIRGKAPAWYGDRKQSTVWEASRGNVSKYVHPTQKPLELLAIPIRNSSKPGDLVVDYFGGSGSTLMTCEQMDRECRLMEIDPKFCDVIKKRFQEATGIEPVLVHRENEQ